MDIQQLLVSLKTNPNVGFLDPLTGIPNRYFFDLFVKESKQLNQQFFIRAIYLIDLDYFKEINDLFGYIVGDNILLQVANRLNVIANSESGVALRIGGDEFVILVDKISNEKKLAEKLIDSINKAFVIDEVQHFLQASIGYIANPKGVTLSSSLIKKIGFSLQVAKKSGKNKSIGFHNKEQNKPYVDMLATDSQIHEINLAEFRLDFQTQVDIKKNIIGLESFLRWSHSSLGDLSAIDFLYLIYDHDNIPIFGDFVLYQSFEALENLSYNKRFNETPLTINMSPVYFQQSRCKEILSNFLKNRSKSPPKLIIEFSANELPKNLSKVATIMAEFVTLGIKFCIDDINANDISLNELLSLPIHQLKINALTLEMKNSYMIIKSLLSLADILQVPIIAKNIETQEQFNTLSDLGIKLFQGNLITPPKSLNSILKSKKFNYLSF
jgi:diguanylate cyclase (GGDEF)-like protein